MNYYVERKPSDHLAHRGYGSGNFSFGTGSFAGPALKAAKAGKSTVRRKDWSNHKYITKITIGGRVRYIYNQAQLAAAKAGSAFSNVRRKATKAFNTAKAGFENATGITAKRRMKVNYERAKNLDSKGLRTRDAYTRAKSNAKKYEKQYNKSLLGRLEKAGSKAMKAVGGVGSKAAKAVGGATNRAGSKAKKVFEDTSGISAKRATDKQFNRLGNIKRGVNAARQKQDGAYNPKDPLEIARNRNIQRQTDKALAARDRYLKTPLGLVEPLPSWADSQRKKAIKKKANESQKLDPTPRVIKENTITENRIYETPRRKRNRRGGVKKKATVKGKPVQTWETATKRWK